MDRKSLKKPDEFVAGGKALLGSLAKKATLIYSLLGLLIVAGIVIALAYSQRQSKAQVALNAYYEAQQALEKELKAVAEAEAPKAPAVKATDVAKAKAKGKAEAPAQPPASAESVAFKKLDVDSRLPEGTKKLQAVIQEYPSSRAAQEARLQLGSLYLRHGNAEKALLWLEKAAESASGSFEKATALNALGHAYEGAGRPIDAAQAYENAMKQGEGEFRGELLLNMARSYELAGDSAKARSTYDQILSQLPNTQHAQVAELYKSRLQ